MQLCSELYILHSLILLTPNVRVRRAVTRNTELTGVVATLELRPAHKNYTRIFSGIQGVYLK
jgi:hypothetical protein